MLNEERQKRLNGDESPTSSQKKKPGKMHIQISKIREENEEDSDEEEEKALKDKKVIVNKTKLPIKELKGHKKGIRDLAYCEAQKLLISCGFDF